MNQYTELIQKIQSNLSDDLLKIKYRDQNKHTFFGHCYVATETFYHSLSELEKFNWTPNILYTEFGTHWFLKSNISNDVIDITKEQFPYLLDYTKSRGCGFLTKNPSKRTIKLLNRITIPIIHHHKLIYNNIYLAIIPIKSFEIIKQSTLHKFKTIIEGTYSKCIILNSVEITEKKPIIKDLINKLKNNIVKKIHGRKCIISHIPVKIKSEFLNENHIQGNDKSKIHIGLTYQDELISVMTFDNSNGINGGLEEGTYELSRYSVKSNFIVNGSFNKLLKYFIESYSPKEIISFADKNYSNFENIYTKNKFYIKAHVKPDFKYYDKKSNKLFHKLTYGLLYKKRNNLTNAEYCKLIGELQKIWNAGKLKYSLRLDDNKNIIFGVIYSIKNLINDKIYIGQTTRPLSVRRSEYIVTYRNGTNIRNQYLYNSFKKYDFENFEFSILENCTSIDMLNEKEIYWINKFDSTNKQKGYNMESGGKNGIPNTETRNKMSLSHKGIKQSQEWINKRISIIGSENAKKYGKLKTEEEKKYLSNISPKFWLGKERDDETKRKISTSKQGQLPSNTKKVLKINQFTKEIIDTYISTTEASRQNSDFTQSKISRICNGKAKSKKNFSFIFDSLTDLRL